MSLEFERTSDSVVTDDSKDLSVVPQFVSIFNSKGLKPSALLRPAKCVGNPSPPCYGGCYGPPPPCYGGCYGR